MAKKNFIDGLDSIFGDGNDSEELSISTKENKADKKTPSRKQKSSGKDFTADLDSLLQEALQESVAQHAKKKRKKLPVAKSQRQIQQGGRIKRTLSGLDALIRQTVTSSEVEITEHDSDSSLPKKKRVTFSFDREKVDKLKSIARLEKSYIKDIVNGIVSEYIDEYEKSKGDIKPTDKLK
ncbi:MAG: hypothetical protein ACI94Y_002793 [Maribacter sp.]